MASPASPLTLSFGLFEQVWKALVSRRKARKLNVNRDLAWQQLLQDGENADFLHAHVAADDLKRRKGHENHVAKVAKNVLREAPMAGAAPKPERVASKTTRASSPEGRKSASHKVAAKRRPQTRPAATAGSTRRKGVAGAK
jgi:hypothetical protein